MAKEIKRLKIINEERHSKEAGASNSKIYRKGSQGKGIRDTDETGYRNRNEV